MLRRFAYDLRPFCHLAEDDGTQGGASTDDQTNAEGDGSGNDAGKQSVQPGAITFASQAEFQKRVDEMLKDRLAREELKRTKAAEEATRKAQEQALKDQSQFKELADTQAKRLAELEPLRDEIEAHKAEIERYRDVFKAQVDALRKDIPAPIIALLDRMDLVEQMSWITENREQIVGTDGKAIIKASPNGAGNSQELNEQQRRERSFKVRF